MDNFKHFRHSRNNSIDGFVSGGKQHPRNSAEIRAFNQYYRPKAPHSNPRPAVRKVDSFSSIDGFSPGVQPAIPRPGFSQKRTELTSNFEDALPRRTHEPAVPVAEKSKRRFGFRRKKLAKADRKKHEKKGKLRLGLRVSAVLAAFILLVGGGLALRAFLAGRNIFKGGGNSALLNDGNVDPAQLKGEGDGRVNVLIMGKGGEEQSDGPDLTDTIIIASIDPIAKEAALLSIPRDFWVKSPSGYQSKINEVYANAKYAVLNNYSYKQRTSDEAKEKSEKAGIDAIKKTVGDTMGVPIHYHAMIDFTGFRKAIDTVGGIDINVTEDMAVRENMWLAGYKGTYNLNAQPGQQHFDGWKALAFTRSRKTSTRGDFSRAERQRAVILALKDKVLSTGTLANPLKINQLIGDFGSHVTSDFSVNEILRVYDLSKEISSDKIVSVGLDEHVVGDQINGLSVQVPKAGLFDYSDIQNYVRNVMRDAFLKKEDAKVMVLNGTETAGLATRKANELRSFGYNVLSVGDAPTKSYTNTVLVDLRNGDKKYTLNYLEKRFNVQATGALPDNTIDVSSADLVLILGSDQR